MARSLQRQLGTGSSTDRRAATGGPCGDLDIHQDLTARPVNAWLWDLECPSRPRRPRRRARVPKPCGDPESPPAHHT
eukprot:7634958-Pyramimonas_sp.AAC.1